MTLRESKGQRKAGFAFEVLRPNAEVGESLSIEAHEDLRSGGGAQSTVVGLFSRTLLAQSSRDSRIVGALQELLRNLPRHSERQKLSPGEWHFFATQAALFHGGETWRQWNKQLRDSFTRSIVADQKSCERGTWEPQSEFGRVWATAMGALTLESYYRFSASVVQR